MNFKFYNLLAPLMFSMVLLIAGCGESKKDDPVPGEVTVEEEELVGNWKISNYSWEYFDTEGNKEDHSTLLTNIDGASVEFKADRTFTSVITAETADYIGRQGNWELSSDGKAVLMDFASNGPKSQWDILEKGKSNMTLRQHDSRSDGSYNDLTIYLNR